jgi:hypothetical protein
VQHSMYYFIVDNYINGDPKESSPKFGVNSKYCL